MYDTSMEFLNSASLQLIGGATLAVSVIANTLQVLLNRTSPWFAFLASVLIVVVIGLLAGSLGTATGVAIAFVNACLLFCTASGLQGLVVHTGTAAASREGVESADKPATSRGFGGRPWAALLRPWFRSA